jgi:acyl-CoA thioesterase FadM
VSLYFHLNTYYYVLIVMRIIKFVDKMKMHVWEVMLFCIQCRLGVSFDLIQNGKEHFFTDFLTVSLQYLIFSISIRVEMTDAFFEIYDKSERTPLLFKTYPAYIGKSAFNLAVEIYNASTKEIMVRNFMQLVSVDKDTRKSSALPDWFQEKYRNLCTGSPIALPAVTKPESNDVASYISDVKLPFTDADLYGHINISSYIKYAIQTAMEASAKGVFKGLFHGGSKMCYRAKTLHIEFLSETKPGGTLTVSAWKVGEGADKQKVHFDLMRQEKKVCRAYVDFDEVEDLEASRIPTTISSVKKYQHSAPMMR